MRITTISGGARNKGLELASKEYVQMIDSDDYIFLAQEQEILKIVEKKSPEALIFNYKKVTKCKNPPKMADF